jgi:threonine synthase
MPSSPEKTANSSPVHAAAPSLGGVLQQNFTTTNVSDSDMLAEVKRVWEEHQYLVDPHTAVALVAAHRLRWVGEEVVILATAHACKFEEALKRALGQGTLKRLLASHAAAMRPPQVQKMLALKERRCGIFRGDARPGRMRLCGACV